MDEAYLRSYLELFITVAFFRVPRFRQLFLRQITGESEEKKLVKKTGSDISEGEEEFGEAEESLKLWRTRKGVEKR